MKIEISKPWLVHNGQKLALGAAISFLIGSLIKGEKTLKERLDEEYERKHKKPEEETTEQ